VHPRQGDAYIKGSNLRKMGDLSRLLTFRRREDYGLLLCDVIELGRTLKTDFYEILFIGFETKKGTGFHPSPCKRRISY